MKRYENRIINVHPSLIPAFCGTGYYGLRVHEAALARGVKITGATVHFVNEGMDTVLSSSRRRWRCMMTIRPKACKRE